MRSPPARDGADGRPLLWPRRHPMPLTLTTLPTLTRRPPPPAGGAVCGPGGVSRRPPRAPRDALGIVHGYGLRPQGPRCSAGRGDTSLTPAALRALARVLGALLAWRHDGRRPPTPSPTSGWASTESRSCGVVGGSPRPPGAPLVPAVAPAHFSARRRPQLSGGAGAVKAGARAFCAPPVGLGLDRRSPLSR
jgi:hypothetical protein